MELNIHDCGKVQIRLNLTQVYTHKSMRRNVTKISQITCKESLTVKTS